MVCCGVLSDLGARFDPHSITCSFCNQVGFNLAPCLSSPVALPIFLRNFTLSFLS